MNRVRLRNSSIFSRQKKTSNFLAVRIIYSRSWYQKGEFEKLTNDLEKRSWAALTAGDGDVWRQFVDVQIARLYGTFMKRWPNPSLAEELVQKTIFDAVRGKETYDPLKGSPEEWIYGIARNNIRLEIRKRASKGSIDGDLNGYLEKIDAEPLPDEILEQRQTARIVRRALNSLEIRERKVLELKYIEGLRAKEICRQLEITEKAVHSLLYRARNTLRGRLKQLAPLNKEERKS